MRTTALPRSRVDRWLVARLLVLVAVLAFVIRTVAVHRVELAAAGSRLAHVRPGWLAVAVLVEVVSYYAYAQGQRLVLAAGGGRVGLGPLTALAAAAQATAYCVPGGLATSSTVTIVVLRRRGVDDALAAWSQVVTSALYIGALALLTLLGAGVALGARDVPGLGTAVTGGLLLLGLVVGGAVAARLPGVRRRLRRLAAGAGGRLVPGDGGTSRVAGWRLAAARLGRELLALRLPGRTAAAAGLLVASSWLADAGCLLAAFGAVGAAPPWRGVLLCYCAAALVAALPVLPGGVGVVEGGLTVALVAYGSAPGPALAAVLLYRLLSFWALLPVGGAAYLLLRGAGAGSPVRPVSAGAPRGPEAR